MANVFGFAGSFSGFTPCDSSATLEVSTSAQRDLHEQIGHFLTSLTLCLVMNWKVMIDFVRVTMKFKLSSKDFDNFSLN